MTAPDPYNWSKIAGVADATTVTSLVSGLAVGVVTVQYFGRSGLEFPAVGSEEGTVVPTILPSRAVTELRGARGTQHWADFALKSQYSLRGLLPLGGRRWVDFQDGFKYASIVPVQISFERRRLENGLSGLANIRVERGRAHAALAYGTEVKVEVTISVGAGQDGPFADVGFEWSETGVFVFTQPRATLRIRANGAVDGSPAFRTAVGSDGYDKIVEALSSPVPVGVPGSEEDDR